MMPYNPDVEPRFKCLRIINIPARREIRVLIFRALQPFTREFGPIVRFKVPGPYQNTRQSKAPSNNGEALVVTAYVYFRSTAAPRAKLTGRSIAQLALFNSMIIIFNVTQSH